MVALSLVRWMVSFILILGGCLQVTPEEEDKGVFKVVRDGEREAPSTSTPILVSLQMMPELPVLNEAAEITVTVRSVLDAPNTTARIVLPEGVTLVSGDLTWQGDLKANLPISFSANITLTKAENIRIEAYARHIIDEENSWGDMDVIYLYYSVSQEVMAEQVEPGDGELVSPARKGKDGVDPKTQPILGVEGVGEVKGAPGVAEKPMPHSEYREA